MGICVVFRTHVLFVFIKPDKHKSCGLLISLNCVTDLNDDAYLHYLLEAREFQNFMELAMKLMQAGKKGLFDAWMMKESDLVQVTFLR